MGQTPGYEKLGATWNLLSNGVKYILSGFHEGKKSLKEFCKFSIVLYLHVYIICCVL